MNSLSQSNVMTVVLANCAASKYRGSYGKESSVRAGGPWLVLISQGWAADSTGDFSSAFETVNFISFVYSPFFTLPDFLYFLSFLIFPFHFLYHVPFSCVWSYYLYSLPPSSFSPCSSTCNISNHSIYLTDYIFIALDF